MNDSLNYEGRDLEVLAECPQYYKWIVDEMRPFFTGRGIEYGPGRGTISEYLVQHLTRLDLVEPSVCLIDDLERKFTDANVVIHNQPLEHHVVSQADSSVDTIVMVNVLEHVEDDRKALAELARMLAPGGYLCIFVPALEALMSDLDRKHGHFRRYHLGPLQDLCRQAGLEVVKARYWDMPGMVAWWLVNTVGGAVDFNQGMVSVYDRLVVPVARFVERLISPPFGKNIMLIVRKPVG